MRMSQENRLQKSLIDLRDGPRLLFVLGVLLGLLSGCSSTEEKDSAPSSAPDVSEAPATAFRNHLPLIRFREVTNQLTGINVMNDSSLRHSHLEMRTRPTGLVSA